MEEVTKKRLCFEILHKLMNMKYLNNIMSIILLSVTLLLNSPVYSPVGCHVIAPSDMMDNRIAAIKDILHKNGYGGKVYCIMSTKFNIHMHRGGGGDSNIKKVGVLVVSLRGVNFRFWSRLGC